MGWLFSILLSCIAFVIYFLTVGHWLTIRSTPKKADAIHVLGGDSCDFHRTKHAISLYRSGVADTIIFTGADTSLQSVLAISESLGLPKTKRFSVDSCQSTLDEALGMRKLHKAWRSIIIITDIYHTRRAVHTFQKILPQITVFSSPAYNSNYNERFWWKTEAGFVDVFVETAKIIYYFIKYGINPI